MTNSTETVKIVEVALRDGLQNINQEVSNKIRLDWLHALEVAGLKSIELGSFVSPKKVPQMAGTYELFEQVKDLSDIDYIGLVPNLHGYNVSRACKCQSIAVFASASETFSEKNIGCSIENSFDRFKKFLFLAKEYKQRIRGYVSCAIECPYEGLIEPKKAAEIAKTLFELECDEISIADTLGRAAPRQIKELLDAVCDEVPVEKIALHCHDTYGLALANVMEALDYGVRVFDSATGGLGGCPYAPGAAGNLNTEDLVFALEAQGLDTGINLDQIVTLGRRICTQLNLPNRSRVAAVKIAQNSLSDFEERR